ncbi:MAG: hypothetical protein LBT76_01370 [Tannerella sp.]|jgi:hypothetical protein|nr:hypothetical protein [Tannerella sp.]
MNKVDVPVFDGMKGYGRTGVFLLWLALGMCTACTDYEVRRMEDEAERQITICPDSARTLLEDAALLFPASDPLHARWCLLSGMVEDEMRKNGRYGHLLPVNEWLRATACYDRKGTTEEQAQIP